MQARTRILTFYTAPTEVFASMVNLLMFVLFTEVATEAFASTLAPIMKATGVESAVPMFSWRVITS